MMDAQPSLFDLPLAPKSPLPAGFRYQAELITAAEERDLVASFQALPFKPYEHLGYFGHRRIAGFGWRQDDAGAMVETGEPIPDLLLPLLAKVASFTGLAPRQFPPCPGHRIRAGRGDWLASRPAAGRGRCGRIARFAMLLSPAAQGRGSLGPR